MLELGKEIREAKTLMTLGTRGINELIAALRNVDLNDRSDDNMFMLDNMIRGLAYMNKCRHMGLYFYYKLQRMSKYQKHLERVQDDKIKKLRYLRDSQAIASDDTFTEWLIFNGMGEE